MHLVGMHVCFRGTHSIDVPLAKLLTIENACLVRVVLVPS